MVTNSTQLMSSMPDNTEIENEVWEARTYELPKFQRL